MWAFLVINMTCRRKRDQLLRTLFEMNFCYNCAGDCFCCNYAVRGFCSTYAAHSFCNKYAGDDFYWNYADGSLCSNYAGDMHMTFSIAIIQVTLSFIAM